MRGLRSSPHDKAIFALAIPALGSLVADPLLSLVDTAFVGRLGADALAALGVSAAVFGVAFFIFNFLEYGTTTEVAKAVGRGDIAGAGRSVVTSLGLAVVAGTGVTAVLIMSSHWLVGAFGATGGVAASAAAYVGIRALAAPAVLVVRAANGAFRGFQNTRTPMAVALGANAINLVLDPLLIFGFGWGIEGAAWATVIAQWAAAAWFLVLFKRRADHMGLARARPVLSEVRRFLRVGRDLAIRSASLLAIFTFATVVATRISSITVAAHQVLSQLFLLTALLLDALAIAAQALVGKSIGAGDVSRAREIADRLLVVGVASGVLIAVGLAAISGLVPGWFTDDPGVRQAIRSGYWILVALQPVAALVFVWDGVFIGVGDFRFLALAMVISAAAGAVMLAAVIPLGWGLSGVWGGLTGFLIVRCCTLAWRRWGSSATPLAG